ncbi:MAG: ABC transporter permease, partial [Oligoflexia bacterium]|nr:ABC transporter permease [Oligoflexia bacterium]
GQRKRLNIALELIRGPDVLFVDEPTSGLSSNDAENVMSLLKEQASYNKLVFVVIHQPSSKIFRMFDSLWILDSGGLLIFKGTPLEAVSYFRSQGNIPGAEDAICANCGSTNPEQIFEIIESKTIDQNGHFTRNRRISPEKWREIYLQHLQYQQENKSTSINSINRDIENPTRPHIHRPGIWGQFKVFFNRDFRARIANQQYVLITLLEPLLLGLLIGIISKGFNGGEYLFYDNKNIPVFFFMSVMVALFLGLSVSSEEICRDQKILKRERFLNLSWWSYINSKIFYLALVASIQMFLYTIFANYFVRIENFNFKSWIVLFLSAFASSVLGLNISAIFRSAITIYILIPLILIPQMILSGAVIKYEGLIDTNSLKREVPFYTNIFFSRFAYEALIVEQYVGNDYMKNFVGTDSLVRQAEYELDHYIPEMQSKTRSALMLLEDQNTSTNKKNNNDLEKALLLLKNEISEIEKRSGIPFVNVQAIYINKFNKLVSIEIDEYLMKYRKQIFEKRKNASTQKRNIENSFENSFNDNDTDTLETLKKKHTNLLIQKLVLNLDELQPILATDKGFSQNILPIYKMPKSIFGNAHFLASKKQLGDYIFPTFIFNMLTLILLTFLLYITLYFRVHLLLLRAINICKK